MFFIKSLQHGEMVMLCEVTKSKKLRYKNLYTVVTQLQK